jgi:SNF2 family DNA or RNA helicase
MGLERLHKELAEIEVLGNEANVEITVLNAEIERMRSKVAELRNKRADLRAQYKYQQNKIEQYEREQALKQQQEAAEAELNALREQAAKIRAEAPWSDQIFDWQFDGAVILASAGRSLLADGTGMGKTLSSIAWRRVVQSKKTLIATRKQYIEEFIKELAIREPKLSVLPLVSTTAVQRKAFLPIVRDNPDEMVVVTNIETWRRDIEKTVDDFLAMGFDAVILDEAHHIKTPSTGTAKGFWRLSAGIPKVLTMTGTPIKNRPQEIFSILHALYPDIFPTPAKFLFDYCANAVDEHGNRIPNRYVFTRHGLQSLLEKISGFYLGRNADDVGHKIPPPMVKHYQLDFEGYEEQAEA